ncbi:dienelactone hydrolase family protein [Alphaproteobacteria bacterium LSUCC0684]
MKNLLILGFICLFSAAAFAGEPKSYKIGDETFEGYHAAPSTPSRGLVLVIHDWDGLTDYEIRRADMLAAMGYEAFAVDLYGAGNRPVETAAKKAEAGRLYQDRARMRQLILGGLDAARGETGRKAVIMGYCFGGAAVLELARSMEAENIAGFATFHGGLKTPQGQSYSPDTPPLLIAHGGADTSIPMADVAALAEELEAAGLTYEIGVYSGAPHAFTVFGSPRYQEVADRKSWQAFTDFLNTHLVN